MAGIGAFARIFHAELVVPRKARFSVVVERALVVFAFDFAVHALVFLIGEQGFHDVVLPYR